MGLTFSGLRDAGFNMTSLSVDGRDGQRRVAVQTAIRRIAAVKTRTMSCRKPGAIADRPHESPVDGGLT